MVYLKNLVAKDKIQVFLFTCPGNIPFVFATHPWFVVNRRGSITRWEILFRQRTDRTSWGHLYKDFLGPWDGLGILPYFERYFSWRPRLLGYCEDEVAQQMADRIESSPTAYPHRFKFFLTGPNSNTYAQWVLDNSTETMLKLPWNSFGKSYAKTRRLGDRN